MLLDEIIEQLAERQPSTRERPDSALAREEFGGLTGREVIEIVKTTALVQALEEAISCLGNPPNITGSNYKTDVVEKARRLSLPSTTVDTLDGFSQYIQFFIPNLGPHLVNVVDAFFSAGYYKQLGRSGLTDKDPFFGYYRTSTGIGIALGAFSALNNSGGYYADMVEAYLRVALGDKHACATMMPEHVSALELGLTTDTSMVGANVDIAGSLAIALDPLLRGKEMKYASDAVVHCNMGDGAANQPTLRMICGMLRNRYSLLAQHYGVVSSSDMKGLRDMEDRESALQRERDIYQRLFERLDPEDRIKLAMHIADNGLAISAERDVVHPLGNPLAAVDELVTVGLMKTVSYNGFNLRSVLQHGAQISRLAREHGLVAARFDCTRPGGHSRTNFFGLGYVDQRTTKGQSTLTAEQMRYHNNNDPLNNALTDLIQEGYITGSEAGEIIRYAQRSVLEVLASVLRTYTPKTKSGLAPVMAYTPPGAQTYWSNLVDRGTQRRADWWKGTGLSGGYWEIARASPDLKVRDDDPTHYLPEHLHSVTTTQAENFSIFDLWALIGQLRALGEDVPDASPFDIERVVNDPQAGLGGINGITAKLQLFAHILDPQTGRHHVFDIGVNEAGIHAMAAGLKYAFGENAMILKEIQFHDYNFPYTALEQISSAYQRSNGRDNIPIIMRHNYGFMRRRDVGRLFEEGGPAGMYHSALTAGEILNRYPGIAMVIPNTTHAIQMAYRNAAASRTPTLIAISGTVMSETPMGSFEYRGPYLPLTTKLEPLGTAYLHPAKDKEGQALPIEAHDHVILTYGEYVPVCYMVAEQLLEREGIKTLVVDYNTLNPRNRRLPQDILAHFRGSGRLPKWSVVSQEGSSGFGSNILNDLSEILPYIDQEQIGISCAADRKGEWRGEHLKNPSPDEIYRKVVAIERGEPLGDQTPPGTMRGESRLLIL